MRREFRGTEEIKAEILRQVAALHPRLRAGGPVRLGEPMAFPTDRDDQCNWHIPVLSGAGGMAAPANFLLAIENVRSRWNLRN